MATSRLATARSQPGGRPGLPASARGRAERAELLRRLRRVDGQVRAIARMVHEGADCVHILTQVAAVRAALRNIGLLIVERHARECIALAVQEDDHEQSVTRVLTALERFMSR